MTDRCVLLVGTPKGAFILEGDARRRDWRLRGPLCEDWPIHDISVEPGTGALLAGGGSPWWGPAVWRSEDLGETWTHSSEGLTYGDDGPKVTTVWNVTATADAIYAGVEPAGLFRSVDRGRTWTHVEGLTAHPSRPEWVAGNGGLILHTIVPHPTDPDACGSGSRPSACSRRGTAARRGPPAIAASAPTSTRRSTRSSASASTSSCLPRAEPGACTSRTTAASTAPTTAASPGTRSPRACPRSSASR